MLVLGLLLLPLLLLTAGCGGGGCGTTVCRRLLMNSRVASHAWCDDFRPSLTHRRNLTLPQAQAKGFVAGLGAGAAEATLVTTAQETIKIKLIDDQFSREKPLYRNFFHGVKTIVSESGLSG